MHVRLIKNVGRLTVTPIEKSLRPSEKRGAHAPWRRLIFIAGDLKAPKIIFRTVPSPGSLLIAIPEIDVRTAVVFFR